MLPALASRAGDIPRLVHRLDRDTGGRCVCLSWHGPARRPPTWAPPSRARSTKKIYWALCAGVPRVKQGRISTFLAKGEDEHGDQKMKVVRQSGDASQRADLLCRGRQLRAEALLAVAAPGDRPDAPLRVHTAEMGHPIVVTRNIFNVENWELPGRPAEAPASARAAHRHAAAFRPDARCHGAAAAAHAAELEPPRLRREAIRPDRGRSGEVICAHPSPARGEGLYRRSIARSWRSAAAVPPPR